MVFWPPIKFPTKLMCLIGVGVIFLKGKLITSFLCLKQSSKDSVAVCNRQEQWEPFNLTCEIICLTPAYLSLSSLSTLPLWTLHCNHSDPISASQPCSSFSCPQAFLCCRILLFLPCFIILLTPVHSSTQLSSHFLRTYPTFSLANFS